MRIVLPLLLLAAAPFSASAQSPLQSTNVTPPAQLIHQGKAGALLPRKPISAGDVIRTGARGSAGLQLVGDSVVTIGGDSELFVHSMEPAGVGRGPLLRLQLRSGFLKLDAYPPAHALPHDYRLNLGSLRVRALGTDLWGYVNSNGEGICLKQGAVEITGPAGAQRLDVAGDCVQHDAASGSLRLRPQAEQQVHDELQSMPTQPLTLAPAPAASLLPPVAETEHVVATHTATPPSNWVVVLASFPTRDIAEQIATAWQSAAPSVTVMEVGTPATFRVISGDYKTRKQAAHAAAQLHQQARFKHAWVAQSP